MEVYYVYELCFPTGEPFYVGKGKGNRIDVHEKQARRGCNLPRHQIIRMIWEYGQEVRKEKLAFFYDEEEALLFEKRVIAFYGKDSLTNLTSGGQGASGRTLSEEGREKIRKANKGNTYCLGRTLSQETRNRIGKAREGFQWSEEAKKHMSLQRQGGTLSEDHKKKIGKSNEGKKHSKESVRRSAEKHAREYPSFVSPQGTIYPPGKNLTQFCTEQGLNRKTLLGVIKGEYAQHKGWTLYSPS